MNNSKDITELYYEDSNKYNITPVQQFKLVQSVKEPEIHNIWIKQDNIFYKYINGKWTAITVSVDSINSVLNSIEYFNSQYNNIVNDINNINNKINNLNNVTNLDWRDLVRLVEDGGLIPGMQYRFLYGWNTNYTNSVGRAGHIFDIIVTAIDEHTLNENARAAKHNFTRDEIDRLTEAGREDEITYFDNSNLDAWELKYCLNPTDSRFEWGKDGVDYGIIYYMKDEWENECPYDFKNILFYRTNQGFSQEWLEEVFGDTQFHDEWLYTFSWWGDGAQEAKDLSIIGNTGELRTDEGVIAGVYNNVIEPVFDNDTYGYETNHDIRFELPENIFVFTYAYDYGFFYGCCDNKINGYNNIFGNCEGVEFMTPASGSVYSPSNRPISRLLELGETSTTAFAGDRGLALEQEKIDKTEKAQANGIATLNENIKVPSEQILFATNEDIYKLFNHEPDYVDLGLPSGTKWAKCNIGANSPEEAGLYFAWAETQGYTADQIGTGEGKKAFSWDDYNFGKYNSSDADKGMKKYNKTDGKATLEAEDDAAYQATNGRFRMPTHEQQVELFNNTNKEWVQENGVYGYKFTNKSDSTKYIFVPAVGRGYNGSLNNVGYFGYYWSSSLRSDNSIYAYCLRFNSDSCGWYRYDRCYGLSVRGVLVE